ncbi:cyclase family protein [Pontibacter sp. G13]|uniref:cyclase family protein n=1 Tax=Pontibacter sp. G13 TaxID=3074898 RepID=UPI00288B5619|nr:cyclase family protein [Pontibacter sp. G13]WNJ17612.1 cyclase family protein [Pontibacter sp. G13]
MRFIDLSHLIDDGLVTYQGLPAVHICDFLSREDSKANYADGTEFQIGKIEMVGNSGTYLDAPFHRFADGKDLSELPLEKLVNLPAIVVDVAGEHVKAIDAEYFDDWELKGHAVLIRTGWYKRWNTEGYYQNHPFITEDAAQFLVEAKVALVGIDSYNIDDTRGNARPAHTHLLGAEIPIVEHLNSLEELPERGFQFSAIPPKIKGFGTFPVRAFATLEE